jgi:hypothetical protein
LEPYYIWIDHLSRTHFGVYAALAAASASYGTAPAQLFFNHSSLYILQALNERIKERKEIFEQKPLRMSRISACWVQMKRSESITFGFTSIVGLLPEGKDIRRRKQL